MSPIEWVVILVSLISGTLGALGVGGYFYFRDRADLQNRRRWQEQHLARVQRLTSKLLNALDRLVGGSIPEETILYQRFKAHGGEYYTDIQADVIETLHRSQSALNAAFELRQQLIDPDTRQSRSLEQQIWDWEMLYATLAGRSEHILNMTGDEIRVLLDPLADPGNEAEPDELVEQLEELRRELAGQPLKVKWQQIQPHQFETQGILDYVDQLKTQLVQLPERHKQEAPYWLAEARHQRQQAEADVPPFLAELYQYLTGQPESRGGPQSSTVGQTKAKLLADIDQRLAQAAAAQTQGRFLEVVEQAYAIWQDMDILRAFLQAISDHGRQRAKIEAVTAAGYRPPTLADDLEEIKEDIDTITQRILSGDYHTAAPWITELNTDSLRSLIKTEAWRVLHHQNIANLDHLRDQNADTARWLQTQVESAWQQLQTYHRQNWSDVATEMEQTRQAFERLKNEQVDQIESLNGMELQKFTEAERLLTYAQADLSQVGQQFQAIVDRLAEVQAAETRLAEALRLTGADLTRAEALRDQEDIKIGPEVDRQIEQARHLLAEAERLMAAGEFIAAVNKQTTARQLATAAYLVADEQVREINARQAQLETAIRQTKENVEQCLTSANQLEAVVQTVSTSRLVRQLQDKVSEAEQARLAATNLEDRALAEALQTAIEAFDTLNQQAEWVTQQIAADQAEYDELLNQTLTTLADAQEAIRQAEQTVTQADDTGAGQHALKRAQTALPTIDDTKQATREALTRIRQRAEEAARYAQLAENQARWRIRLAQARQNLRQPAEDRETKRRLRRLSDRTEQVSS